MRLARELNISLAFFLNDLLSLMDRGYVLNLIRNHMKAVSRCFTVIEMQFRSSHPEMFCKKGVLNNFSKFTGKHLCQSLLYFAILLKKRLWHRCLPVNFAKFLRTLFLLEHLWWLLLAVAWRYSIEYSRQKNWKLKMPQAFLPVHFRKNFRTTF